MTLLPTTFSRRLNNARAWWQRDTRFIESGKTAFDVVHHDGLASLRYYPPLATSHIQLMDKQVKVANTTRNTPIVLVPPLAVNMSIYDLFPERSFVRYLLSRGFPVYLIDWGSPSRKNDNLTLASYFADRLPAFLDHVRQHSGKQDLSLHGWSLGGLFSYAAAALSHDKHLRNLVLLGAPCDYHANGSVGKQYQRLSRYLQRADKWAGLRVHKLPPQLWRAPGIGNSLGFKLLTPAASIKNYFELLRNLGNDDFVVKHATNSAFLDRMEPYPGACMQDIVQYLLGDNVLPRGRLPMTGTPAALSNIKANLLMINGHDDVVVSAACSHALLKIVSSTDITRQNISGGHMSIVGGKSAATESWPLIADWLIKRDEAAILNPDKQHTA